MKTADVKSEIKKLAQKQSKMHKNRHCKASLEAKKSKNTNIHFKKNSCNAFHRFNATI